MTRMGSTCPHCNKIINHREKCIVLKNQEQKEQKELEKKNKLELEEELKTLGANYPQVSRKFDELVLEVTDLITDVENLIDENSTLQDRIDELEYNNINQYCTR